MTRRRLWILILVAVWIGAFGAALGADRAVAQWVHGAHLYNKRDLAIRLLKLPGTFWFALGIAALIAIFHSRSWRAAAPLLFSGPLVGFAYILMKWSAGRHRPDKIIAPFDLHPFARGIVGLIHAESGLSFPSGHAAMAFATAVCLAAAWPRAAGLFFAVAAAVGAERVLENAHYLSDVVAGAGVGVLCGLVAVLVANRWIGRTEHRGFPVLPADAASPDSVGPEVRSSAGRR